MARDWLDDTHTLIPNRQRRPGQKQSTRASYADSRDGDPKSGGNALENRGSIGTENPQTWAAAFPRESSKGQMSTDQPRTPVLHSTVWGQNDVDVTTVDLRIVEE